MINLEQFLPPEDRKRLTREMLLLKLDGFLGMIHRKLFTVRKWNISFQPALFKAKNTSPLTGVLHVIPISPQSSEAGGQVFARLLSSQIIPLPASPEGCWCVSRVNSVKSSASWQVCRPRGETSSDQATPRTDQHTSPATYHCLASRSQRWFSPSWDFS